VVLNKRIEIICLKGAEMLKHDKVKKPKHISAIHTKEEVTERLRTKGLKKDIIDIRRKLFTNHTKTSLYTPTFLKTFKNIYKMTETLDPHARFRAVCWRQKILQ
jgi:hypothetical protein